MTFDPDRFATLICDWCLEVTPGQRVLVATTTLAEEYAMALHRAILQRDAWPHVWLSPPGLAAGFYRHARERHLGEAPPIELAMTGALDAHLRIDAPASTTELAGVDPTLIARHSRALRPIQALRRQLRWCATIVPTPALAQQAGMATADHAAFLERALFLDRPDPGAAWQELSAGQARLTERLASAREVRIEADGTDLRLSVAGRRWINSDGRRNMPSGEVFTGPVETSAEGRVRFTVPSGHRGVTVSGVELEFRAGVVVGARAERGQEHLDAALATDPGARRLGELGIGTNAGIDRATGQTLLDEKIAGTVHLALGRSYPETGGTNESSLHWDLVCDLRDGGRLTVDDEPLLENGVIPL